MTKPEINVLYFAAASTATGLSSELVPIPPDFRLRKILDGSKWSVDAEMVDDLETELKGGEEVAVICPVSGG